MQDTVAGIRARAARIRADIVRMGAGPEGAHVGGALSAADILAVLYAVVLRVRPHQPEWPDRDYFVLSKGHASAALYAALAEFGFLSRAELATYARPGSRLGGHPLRRVPGVEFPTGSLGHGLSLGLGLALSALRDQRPNRAVVLLGDGELQEGSVWEAAGSAYALGVGNLTAVVDVNGLQINGSTRRTAGPIDLTARWRGFGWSVAEVDGHDVEAVAEVLTAPPAGRPTVVLARTVKGRGVDFLEGRPRSHYVTLSGDRR